MTAHAAFQKAAKYFGLEYDAVSVGADGRVEAGAIAARLGSDVALVVVSAPSYPHAALDPIEEVAAAASALGIPVHVDACIGGWVLPFWPALPAWDSRGAGRHEHLRRPAQVRLRARRVHPCCCSAVATGSARSTSRRPAGPAIRS